jgi:hypothetical protein
MSTVLPELERLLDTAAARHYRRRRRPPWAVRWAIAAGAVAVVLLAFAALRTGGGSDERPASQRPSATADDPLGNAYTILAKAGPAPDPALWREFDLAWTFESRASSIWRLARKEVGRRILVTTGINEVTHKRLVCVLLEHRIGIGTICEPAAELLAERRPWVLPIGTGPVVLVHNDVARVWLRLADGTERELRPRNNVAIGSGYNACFVRWVRADGSRGRAPVDGAPRDRCG